MKPNYENHPFIKSLKDIKKWTVSDKNKVPMDMVALLKDNKVYGAKYRDDRSLVDFHTLKKYIAEPSKFAYFIRALEDNFLCIDIEPGCSEKTKGKLLRVPYFYGEKSMSGKGYHLFLPLPKNAARYPHALNLPALKSEKGEFEILLNHYVTFTGDLIPLGPGDLEFEKVFESLAKPKNKEIKTRSIDTSEDFLDLEIIDKEKILELIDKLTYVRPEGKFLNDDGSLDNNKYEYSVCSFYYYKITSILRGFERNNGHFYTDQELAYFMHYGMKQTIDHREKHNTYRNGQPWLIYLVYNLLSKQKERKPLK